MRFDEQVRQAFDTLVERLREDLARRVDAAAQQLSAAAASETERVAAEASGAAAARVRADLERDTAARLDQAEREAASRLAAAVAAAEAIAEAEVRARADAEAAAEQARAAARTAEAETVQVRAELEQQVRSASDAAQRSADAARAADAETVRVRAELEQQARAAAEAARRAADAARAAEAETAQIRAELEEQARAAAAAAQHSADAVRAAEAETDRMLAELEHHVRSGGEAGRHPSTVASERLLEAIRSIDRVRSLSEILDTLVTYAGREAQRAAVLIVRGASLHGWRFVGFGVPLDSQPTISLPLDEAGIVGDAVRTGMPQYATRGDGPQFAQLADGRPRTAVPLDLSGEVVAVLYADQGSSGDPSASSLAVLEMIGRHAARALEAITAFTTARAVNRASADRRPGTAGVAEIRDEDHESARRYARLLVSEIRLYHEAEVVAGRQAGDLGSRLGGEIARARVLYEQRVPSPIRDQADYFQAELVRTLAGGDAALLEHRT